MRRSIKKVAAGLLATMMIGTMLTGCGGGNKKDSGSSKKETSEINIGFSQVGAESDWRVANTKSMKSELTAKNDLNYHLQMLSRNRKIRQKRSENLSHRVLM